MRTRHRRHSSGFTLIELLVSLFVTIEIIIAVLMLFDLNNKLARVQTNIAEMQQSQRIAQYDLVRTVRMAGRGAYMVRTANTAGPPEEFNSMTLGVRNNVAGDIGIAGAPSSATNPKVLPGTDVLRIRGVLTTPVFQVNTVDPAAFTRIDADDNQIPESGVIVIRRLSPTGVPQDLSVWVDQLRDAADRRPEALLLSSPLSDSLYAVVELNPGASSLDGADPSNPDSVTLAYVTIEAGSGTHAAAYNNLHHDLDPVTGDPVFPKSLEAISSVGILEEYRFYIREMHAVAADLNSDLTPRLTRARVFPGTDVPYGPGAAGDPEHLRADIADNVYDLQVAIGLDTNNDQQVTEALPPAATDDWLFNAAADDPEDALFEPAPPAPPRPVYNLRLTTLALTDRRDPKFSAPLLGLLEDHDYATHTLNTSAPNRMFRHRLQTTIVDLRNF